MAVEAGYALLRLPSGEMRKVPEGCRAVVGVVGNATHENLKLGKAGRGRWVGRNPHNRGVTMNPVDHPHGGGEGRTSGGRNPVTPWGKLPPAERKHELISRQTVTLLRVVRLRGDASNAS